MTRRWFLVLAAAVSLSWPVRPLYAQSPPTPPARPVTATIPQPLPQQEAFDVLKALNDREALLEPFVGAKFHYGSLRLENCFGLKWASGERLIGESSGKVGAEGTLDSSKIIQIGFLVSEVNLIIGGKPLDKGSYAVWASSSAILFSTRAVPVGDFAVSVAVNLREASIGSANPALRFALKVEDGGAHLAIESHKVPVKRR